jgi:hypothetical protein
MPPDKIDLQSVTFEIVPDNTRLRTADYGKLPVVIALMEGKTVSVPIDTATDKLYRFARINGYVLRKHKTKEGMIIVWFEERVSIDGPNPE